MKPARDGQRQDCYDHVIMRLLVYCCEMLLFPHDKRLCELAVRVVTSDGVADLRSGGGKSVMISKKEDNARGLTFWVVDFSSWG